MLEKRFTTELHPGSNSLLDRSDPSRGRVASDGLNLWLEQPGATSQVPESAGGECK